MSTQAKIEKMLKKSEVILAAGGEKRVAKQHEAGKMTARERIAALLDEGSFVELDRFVKHRCTNFGQEKKELPPRRCNYWLRHHRWPSGLCIRTRFHCRRWFFRRNACC